MEDKLTMLAPLFLEAEAHEAHLSALYIKTKFSVSILLRSLEHELKKKCMCFYTIEKHFAIKMTELLITKIKNKRFLVTQIESQQITQHPTPCI